MMNNGTFINGRPVTIPEDLLIEVQRGNIGNMSMVHKFGLNDNVPNGSWAHISHTPFAITNFRTSAVAMRVKAGGNAADTAAGAGAREITIQGIDSSFNETSEAVATAGGSASLATSTTFWRVHRAWVSSVGAYTAANTGDVVIEDSGGGGQISLQSKRGKVKRNMRGGVVQPERMPHCCPFMCPLIAAKLPGFGVSLAMKLMTFRHQCPQSV